MDVDSGGIKGIREADRGLCFSARVREDSQHFPCVESSSHAANCQTPSSFLQHSPNMAKFESELVRWALLGPHPQNCPTPEALSQRTDSPTQTELFLEKLSEFAGARWSTTGLGVLWDFF